MDRLIVEEKLESLHNYIPWAWVVGLSDKMNTNELEMLVLIVGLAFFFGMQKVACYLFFLYILPFKWI